MARQLHEEGGNTGIDVKSDIRVDDSRFSEKSLTKIIHQSWKDNDIPYHIYKKQWVDSWTEKNPDWQYI